jgi:hypothetical protein
MGPFPALALSAVAAALLGTAFSSWPLSHGPRPEPQALQLDRPFFVDSIVNLIEPLDRDMFPRETAAPIFDGPTQRTYVSTHDGQVRCLFRGRTAWTAQVRGGVIAASLLDKDDLYVPGAGGELVALNRISGLRRWAADVKEELTTQPTLAEGAST